MDKISLANAHLPQLIGLVLMSIGYTLGNKFYLPQVNKNNYESNLQKIIILIYKSNSPLLDISVTLMFINNLKYHKFPTFITLSKFCVTLVNNYFFRNV